MSVMIVLDPELGVSPREFATAWNADPNYSTQGVLEERRLGQTFDISIWELLRNVVTHLPATVTFLAAAGSIVVNSEKIYELLRKKKFAKRVVSESIEIREERAGDTTVFICKRSKTTIQNA